MNAVARGVAAAPAAMAERRPEAFLPDRGVPAPGWARLGHALLWAALILATVFAFPLGESAPDIFHEGEYAMYGVAGGATGSGLPALLAHGGIDLWPAWIARGACPADAQLVCVRLVNGLFTLVTCGLFALVLAMITGLGTLRALLAGLPAMVTLVAYFGAGRSAFFMQTGTPNLRELFMLAILAGLFWLFRAGEGMAPRGRLAAMTGIGLVAGFGLFWIHNRGQFGMALTLGAAFALGRAWPGERLLPGAVLGMLGGIGLAWASGLYGDIPAQFEAMLYWVTYNDIYRVSPGISVAREVLPVVPLWLGLLGAVALILARRGWSREIIPMLVLVAVMYFYAWQCWLRPFTAYVAHTLWGISLLFALLFMRAAPPGASRGRMTGMAAVAVLVGAFCTLLNLRYMPPNPLRWATTLTENLRVLARPLPRDATLVEPGIVEAAALARQLSPDCSYSFTNEGMFYVLAEVRPCSRFAYPFYVSRDHQAAMIAEIEATRPALILWRSPSWANAIYERDLADRTPEIAARIPELYPWRRVLAGGYEVRGRAPFEGASR